MSLQSRSSACVVIRNSTKLCVPSFHPIIADTSAHTEMGSHDVIVFPQFECCYIIRAYLECVTAASLAQPGHIYGLNLSRRRLRREEAHSRQ